MQIELRDQIDNRTRGRKTTAQGCSLIRTRLLVIAAILASFGWHFGAVLLQGRSFGFRDAANYYYPLFEWECGEWRAGRVPTWNPLDEGGTPVLADTTSSVLYPGKLVFVLPASFRLRYHIYVTSHVLLAAAAAYGLARQWACSREASGLAAVAYAFGGSVLFQYCNVVFLVGAAWLPYGLLATDRMLRDRSLGWSLTLGTTLALMVLGGDPQAAYHTGILSALYAFSLGRNALSAKMVQPLKWRSSPPALLATAALVALGLSLVQILPAADWTRQSNRDLPEAPRNIYEAAKSLTLGQPAARGTLVSGMLRTPRPGTHLRHVYEFSVGPWHLAEFVWPNIFGRTFPKNERWSSAIPAEGRTWTPSLYLGLLPIVLALLSWRVRRCDPRIRFMSLLALLALLGSFGWYAVGWLADEARASFMGADMKELTLGPPVGGVYWLLVTLLPGYVYFRYPAKLLVIASLGVCLLAARGWDELVEAKSPRVARAVVVVAALSLVVTAGFGLCQSPWNSWLATAEPDAIFGPLDRQAATNGVLAALLHATILGLVYWFLLRTTNERLVRFRGILLLAITVLELLVANGWMTRSIPGDVWSKKLILADAIPRQADGLVPPRLHRAPAASLLPRAWSRMRADARLAEVVNWERTTLLPNHHLSANIAIMGSHTTLTSADWQSFGRVARQWDRESAPHASLWRFMSVQFSARPKNNTSTESRESIAIPGASVQLDANPDAFPRAWIVHEIEVIPPLAKRTHRTLDQRTRAVFIQDGIARNLRKFATLETHDRLILPRIQVPGTSVMSESCAILHYSPRRVEIHVQLTEPGCLVFNDTFYHGWQAVRITQRETHALKIYRANRLMRGSLLPVGEHRIIYTYLPRRVVIGGVVSGCVWLLMIAYGVQWVIRTRVLA